MNPARRTPVRRLLAAVLTGVCAAALLLAGAGPASARVDRTGVYSLSYSDDLIYAGKDCDCFYPLDYAGWRDLGFPAPQRISSDFVKYPWSDTVYAVTFFGPDREDWMWKQIDYAEWTRAGRPAPRIAGWIDGSSYFRFELNADIYVTGPDGSLHRLTGAEWAAAGYPSPEVEPNSGFVRLSWSGDIIFLTDARVGEGFPIDWDTWAEFGYPKPMDVTHVANDRVVKYKGYSQLYYEGGGLLIPINGAQWKALGYPKPVVL